MIISISLFFHVKKHVGLRVDHLFDLSPLSVSLMSIGKLAWSSIVKHTGYYVIQLYRYYVRLYRLYRIYFCFLHMFYDVPFEYSCVNSAHYQLQGVHLISDL